jgi:hypothetical protein
LNKYGQKFYSQLLNDLILEIETYPLIEYLFQKGGKVSRSWTQIEDEIVGTEDDEKMIDRYFEKYGIIKPSEYEKVKRIILD